MAPHPVRMFPAEGVVAEKVWSGYDTRRPFLRCVPGDPEDM
jgi:hypothetical protein